MIRDPLELTRLMELMKEYSAKLRQICEAQLNNKSKIDLYYSVIISGFIAAIIIIAFTLIIPVHQDSHSVITYFLFNLKEHILDVAAFVLSLISIILPMTFFYTKSTKKNLLQYDAHQMATTVSKLIQTTSQYSEHATGLLSNKFEFDLRLAEAEASLHMYETVFGHEQKPKLK
jgi:hypothetical protein